MMLEMNQRTISEKLGAAMRQFAVLVRVFTLECSVCDSTYNWGTNVILKEKKSHHLTGIRVLYYRVFSHRSRHA